MMLRILRDKFLRLGRDDDGMAMVVTLAVFMFMWLVCAGVFAIGTAVKTRIHLQNACDAAAYSAAVVQADTLSRIATINRAMSWTYIAMTRRQMDYIVDRWLKHTLEHFNQDKAAAQIWYLSSTPPPPCPIHASWGMGASPDDLHLFGAGAEIDLNNGSRTVLPSRIQERINGFQSYVPTQATSFYATSATVDSLASQIDADKVTIVQMNRMIQDLADKLPRRVKNAVDSVLHATLDGSGYDSPRWHVFQNESPRKDSEDELIGDGYLRDLHNESEDENRFLSFSRQSDAVNAFSTGIDDWFERADRKDLTSGKTGIQRAYRNFMYKPDGKLVSRWAWWSTKSVGCEFIPDVGYVHGSVRMLKTCPHIGINDRCSHARTDMLPSPRYIFKAEFHGNGMCVWDDRYEGARARPLILRDTYFGKSGTITVGLVANNQNPLTPILGTAITGLFSAFSIGKDLTWTPQYTVCFASAKAGYKYLGEDVDNETRAYRISWEDADWRENGQAWNLCQSDWDAVLIPVRRAETFASGRGGYDAIWDGDVGDFLGNYANMLGVDAGSMLAGGSGIDVAAFYGERDLGEEYMFGNTSHRDRDYAEGFWGGADLPKNQRSSVNARWQIGNPNNPIDWAGLQRVMFH